VLVLGRARAGRFPTGVSIRGIEVRLDAKVESTSSSPKMCVQLSWDGGTTWTSTKSTPMLGTSMGTFTLGSATDTWGRSWTTGNLSDANLITLLPSRSALGRIVSLVASPSFRTLERRSFLCSSWCRALAGLREVRLKADTVLHVRRA
jgi:hypothetical protein